MVDDIFSGMDDEELWSHFATSEMELKHRLLVRTRNIVGERGDFFGY